MIVQNQEASPRLSGLDSDGEQSLYSPKIRCDGMTKLSGHYIVFSDIQGTADALRRFFKATKGMKRGGYLCLGDIVNRFDSFEDNLCVEMVRNHTQYTVRGNHEDNTPDSAKVYPENVEFVRSLPTSFLIDNVLLFHSSMKQPGARLQSEQQLQEECVYIQEQHPEVRYALFGHTHAAGSYSLGDTFSVHTHGNVDLQGDVNLINPGGIGLKYGLQRTFAQIDFDTGRLQIFSLEEAEDLARKAGIVNAFDSRWMPVLNTGSYSWFDTYARNDAPTLLAHEHSIVQQIGQTLAGFDIDHLNKIGVARQAAYLSTYSAELASLCKMLHGSVADSFVVVDPEASRDDYINTSISVVL